MGKNKNKKKSKSPKPQEKQPESQEDKLTLAALDAISDDEEFDNDSDGGGGPRFIEMNENSDGELETVDDDKQEWCAEAKALRQAIAEGAFDKITNESSSAKDDDNDDDEIDDDDGSLEEDQLSEDDEEEEDDDEEQEIQRALTIKKNNAKALSAKTNELTTLKGNMPWVETFDVISSEPLPFGSKKNVPGHASDVHDDLKREVAFYNMALDAVKDARALCKDNHVPFTRPDDFFAEMVKTDDHMAKVKDRLIFESKKINAFEQRKANREFKLRAKETHANKLEQKAKHKRDHLQQVDDWAKSAAASRGHGGVMNDDDEAQYERNFGSGTNKRRANADKKYGFGGNHKKGKFKQNDKSSINDMSSYNPRGNFGGAGTKKVNKGKSGGSGGANRQGKRARDASRRR